MKTAMKSVKENVKVITINAGNVYKAYRKRHKINNDALGKLSKTERKLLPTMAVRIPWQKGQWKWNFDAFRQKVTDLC